MNLQRSLVWLSGCKVRLHTLLYLQPIQRQPSLVLVSLHRFRATHPENILPSYHRLLSHAFVDIFFLNNFSNVFPDCGYGSMIFVVAVGRILVVIVAHEGIPQRTF